MQAFEAEITIAIINRFVAMGKVVLTIHDSYIVTEDDKALLGKVMIEEFQNVSGLLITDRDRLIH